MEPPRPDLAALLAAATAPKTHRLAQPRVGIFDTDYLMNQVSARVRGEAAGVPFANLFRQAYVARHVLVELYRPDARHGHRHKWDKLSVEAANKYRVVISPDAFQEVFESTYLPHLRVVDMGELYADEPEVDAVRLADRGRGASDVPTAQLAVLLSRVDPIVFGHDKHLRGPKIAPQTEVLTAATGAERSVQLGESAVVTATAALGGSAYLAERTFVRLGAAFGVAPWVSRAALGALAGWVMSSSTRRAWLGEHGLPLLEFVGTRIEDAERALQVLAAAVVPVTARDDLDARVAEVFVRDLAWRSPALAGDIQAALAGRRNDVESVAEVRAVLQSRSCFVESPRHRYSLGCLEPPPALND